jgi:hypothetical protein
LAFAIAAPGNVHCWQRTQLTQSADGLVLINFMANRAIMQPYQLTTTQAINAAPAAAKKLQALASAHRKTHGAINQLQTRRHWVPEAGCYCYQTHIAISGQHQRQLAWLAELFYRTAELQQLPWYPQFQSGMAMAISEKPLAGITAHQWAISYFDLGLPLPRYYRQLVSLAAPDEQTRVVVARSVTDGPENAGKAKLAFTLDPNGEVLYWQGGCLHWHHICCTPGASLLPKHADRLLMNGLRKLGLDSAERNTYRQEALQMRDWLQSPNPEHAIAYR